MSYPGHIQDGAVVLDTPSTLPNGTPVTVAPIPPSNPLPTLFDRMKDFVGCLDGLPPDAALQHDHYLYGTPKK